MMGCWRYNSDGIDMHNCENVHIDGCFLRTFDDSICVKGFDCYYDEDVEQAVHDAMYRGGKSYDVFKNVLDERERTILCLRFGLSGQAPMTQHKIAEKMGISRSYVSRIEKAALEKIEKNLNIGIL